MSGLPKITVNRCFRPVGFGELKLVELHSFADASQVAYGTVCYLRLVDVNDRMHCALLDGRSRLAYVRPIPMPRLELCLGLPAETVHKRRIGHSSYKVDILLGLNVRVAVH